MVLRDSSDSRYDSSSIPKFFPIIVFTTPAGERIEFRSELGESHRLRTVGTDPQPPWRDG